jgi:hypothetical protein
MFTKSQAEVPRNTDIGARVVMKYLDVTGPAAFEATE